MRFIAAALAATLAGSMAFLDTARPSLVRSAPRRFSAPVLPRIFGDGMVLQRDQPITVWGWGDPGQTVSAALGPAMADTRVSPTGTWLVRLSPQPASGPFRLIVRQGVDSVAISNVEIGDVWVAVGESGMELTIGRAASSADVIANARDSTIRQFKIPNAVSLAPDSDVAGGAWATADKDHVASFSAVAYSFATHLKPTVHVPIGIVNATSTASAIEAWLSRDAQKLSDSAWSVIQATDANHRDSLRPPSTSLYNAMIHPIMPFPIKGLIWYQGESNSGSEQQATAYRDQFRTLILSWRKEWNGGRQAFPFLWVQLPRSGKPDATPPARAPSALQRESMDSALTLPITGRAVTIDLGDIGPRNTDEIGARLALIARRIAYDQRVEDSGPRYKSFEPRGDTIVVSFTHLGTGFAPSDTVGGFAIAGADQKFASANAKIVGDKIYAWSPRVRGAVALRYAWANNSDRARVRTADGLPLSPFRTDSW